MSITSGSARCPMSGAASQLGDCPMSRSNTRMGPRGCAFSGFSQSSGQALYGAAPPHVMHAREQKTMIDLLLPKAPPKEVVRGLKNADVLMPSKEDVLAAALGAPARRVLERAEMLGPYTGWRDGYLSSTDGFCPPDPNASPIALAASPGRVWSDLCERMPGLVARGKIREAILELPLVSGTADVIPDSALWAATVCLGILASVYRYEERNDGTEGISINASPTQFTNANDDPDEEPETKGIPRVVAIPFKEICRRMGRPLPHLTQFDVSICNFKYIDPTSVFPYPARRENIKLRWPVFDDGGEAGFLLCMAESAGCFREGIELVTRCQEAVMNRDNEELLRNLIAVKELVDQLVYVFHKISVNQASGDMFSNPVVWGSRYAKFSAPLSSRVPALSGLALPTFLLLDSFIGRESYKSFLGIEALHLRAWLPLNQRAFITAIESYYQVPQYVKASGDPRLQGVFEGILESYVGERGFLGTHRYKVYGFLEVVAKTGRTETNGNAGAGDNQGRPWEEVHKTLAESMKERMEPFRKSVAGVEPHEMRGCFEECRFKARLAKRSWIDTDPERTTAKITFDISDTGITFGPGDRLAVMPLNSLTEAAKVAEALELTHRLEEVVMLENAQDWRRYASHEATISRDDNPNAGKITVRDILRKGRLQPLAKETVMAVHVLLRASSSFLLRLLSSETWPLNGSLGDILLIAKREISPEIWADAFDLTDISWLPKFISVEVPRTYSISSYSDDYLPSTIDLTVARASHILSPLIAGEQQIVRSGVSSGFLNPRPAEEGDYGENETVLIGISRPLNFQLPTFEEASPIIMFAGGSGIAPFRSFWKKRIASGTVGRTLLFLGVQSRKKFSYEEELRDHALYDGLEVHVAFSRDQNGLIYNPATKTLDEKIIPPRYIDQLVIEKGSSLCDIIMSKQLGGQAGRVYICGSVQFYETVMKGIHQAIYQHRGVTKEGTEQILAAAFAERRLMLDIFMTPRAMSYKEPVISQSALAKHTGHRPGSKMYIGVHGSVYEISGFLPLHPGGTLIAAASAGLDASKTFDQVAHTTNPEVMSLLAKYFIGYLAPKPTFNSPELDTLWCNWNQYLRTCVETLTTLSFEVNDMMEDKIWWSGGLLNQSTVRKFYQFQSRLMKGGFESLFAKNLQELFVKLTFSAVSSQGQSIKLPDVMGIVARAQSSPSAATAQREISQIGEMVCSAGIAQSFEKGLIAYARAAMELDVRFLEQVREEICTGMDGFDLIATMKGPAAEKKKLYKLSAFLVSLLERIAERLANYYNELATLSVYHPEMEKNPARARWKLLRRRIKDGSFFLFTQDIGLDSHSAALEDALNFEGAQPPRSRASRRPRDSISFEAIMAAAQVSSPPPPMPVQVPEKPSLAAAHTLRAQPQLSGTTFSRGIDNQAAHRISQFIGQNLKAIRRLSRVSDNVNLLDAALAKYSPNSTIPHHTSPPAPLRSNTTAQDILSTAARLRQPGPSPNRALPPLPPHDPPTAPVPSPPRSTTSLKRTPTGSSDRSLARMTMHSSAGGNGGLRHIIALGSQMGSSAPSEAGVSMSGRSEAMSGGSTSQGRRPRGASNGFGGKENMMRALEILKGKT